MQDKPDHPRVFISWSGDLGRKYAEALGETFFNSSELTAWVSSLDIKIGEDWFSSIKTELDGCTHAVACITRDAIDSPWVNFEMGVLWQRFDMVKPILLGIEAQQFSALQRSPLPRLQGVVGTSKEGVSKLLMEILRESDDDATFPNFDDAWDEWLKKVKDINRLSTDENIEAFGQAILEAHRVRSRASNDFDFIFNSSVPKEDLLRHPPFDLALYGRLSMRDNSNPPSIVRTAYNSVLLLQVIDSAITESHVKIAVAAALKILKRGIKREGYTLEPWDTQLFLAGPEFEDSAKAIDHTPYANVHLLSFDGEYTSIGPHKRQMNAVLDLIVDHWAGPISNAPIE